MSKKLQDLSPEKRALLEKLLKKKAQARRQAQAIPPRPHPDEHPLSFGQQQLWFFDQLEPESSLYNISGAVRLRGPLQRQALERSMNQVVQRHQVLRARFITEDGEPRQIIAPDLKIPFSYVDLRELPPQQREERALQLATTEAQRPFDLAQGPLLRAMLLQLDDQEHMVVLSMHHIVADGWSIGVFLREMALLYDAYIHDRTPHLPELPIQYADYAHWQRQQLQGDVLDEHLAYWEKQLAGIPPLLELPTDYPRPAVVSHQGSHHQFRISAQLTAQLKALSRSQESTLFSTLLAAYSILLQRYSRQDDIVVGAPFARRDKTELENLIGFFVNMLALRTQLAGNPTFVELLGQVQQMVQDALAHQDLPFEMLVSHLQPRRDPGVSPIFQAAMVFQQKMPPLQLGGVEMEFIATDIGTAKLDISLVVEEDEQGLRCAFRYRTDLFSAQTMARMARHFTQLLQSIVQNPDLPIGSLSLLDESEKQLLLTEWSGSQVDYEPVQAIHQLFEAQAQLNPQEIALEFVPLSASPYPPTRMTYAELNRRANQLAHYLRSLGVGPETLVGLQMRRSPEMLVGLLGVLKAGGAYLPLDPDYPSERIRYMIDDSGVQIVITNLDGASVAIPGIRYVHCHDPELERQPDSNPQLLTYPEHRAYVIYTSGSTGKPKGVEVLHRGVINHAQSLARIYGIGPQDRVLQFITLSFDAAGEEIYPALISGATVVLISSAAELVGGRLLHFCAEHDIHVLHLPASIWHQSVDEMAGAGSLELPLRVLLVGGERPDLARLRIWSQLHRHPSRFINAYGPTEATITALWFEIENDPAVVDSLVRIPVGRPLPNVRAYILDEAMQPVPIGVPGELYLGGEGVARGYLARPQLTAERFLPDPFSSEPEARIYKTGDLARWLDSGDIEFLGRVDEQVKIRGFRVELGEIESSLAALPQVKEAVVVARRDDGVQRLVAYVVPADDSLAVDYLRTELQKHLPEYMIPAAFVLLDELPRLPNGKIDRRSLPEPGRERQVAQEFVAPRDALEEHLAGMWQELLAVHEIGVHDNFFELGGNSILGATFVNRLQDQLGEYIYLVALFDAPTIAQLAAYLRENYPVGVARMLGEDATAAAHDAAQAAHERVVTPADLRLLRELIVPLPPRPAPPADEPKNPQAVFILSAPRSGSTLLRVILGGNPQLFAPPELQLLNYNTLADQQAALGNERDEFWLDGILRAIMELRQCEVDEARAIFQAHIEQKLTVKQFYAILQSWLGDRIFVDKTPNYALDENVLRRAEEDFTDPLYIHLIRHPYAVIPSFEKAKLHVFYPPFFKDEHPFTPGQLAELIWLISHQNILKFLQDVPEQRQHRIYYEDLVQRPHEIVDGICRFLGVDFHPDMLEPQKNPKQRMTDGIHPLARMVGDVRFFEHKGIDGRNAYRWLEKLEVDYLSDMTWDMAQELGYQRLQGWPRPGEAQELDAITPQPRRIDPETGIVENLPLSFGQERLWFLHQLDPESASYNMPVALRLRGELHVSALEQSLNQVIQRHEVLHTSFPSIEGRSALALHPQLRLQLPVEDISAADDPLARARQLTSDEARRPFDLARGPLLRARLLRLGENDHLLLLTMHHIVADGWSMGVFVREVATFYRSLVADESIDLPELPVQYADYAFWQRQWLQRAPAQRQLAYWKRQLAGAPELLDLPTDFPRPQEPTERGAFETFHLPADLVEPLRHLANQQGATMFMALTALFQVLLYRYSGQEDFNIGTPVAGRIRAELEPLIGFFVNTLVLRADLSGQPSFRQLLERVQEVTVQAFAHQDLPFEMLVDAVQPQRAMSHSPLFQVMFVLQDAPVDALELPGLTLSPQPVDTGTAKFDLTLSITDMGDELRGLLEYNTDLFRKSTIQRMIQHLRLLLEGITANPDQPVSDLPLLSAEQRRTLLQVWNDTAREYPLRPVHELFAAQARRTPDATALIFASPESSQTQTMSYGELEQRANRLAHHLRSLGAGPDVLVGLMMPRSLEMMVGLLGILKAGAAYVPIDPEYPAERIRYMLDDAGVQVVVSNLPPGDYASQPLQFVDPSAAELAAYPDSPPAPSLTLDHLAYVIYTSGSTGQPKGVMITHRGLANHALALQEIYDMRPTDRMLQFITLSFDAAGEEIYPTLISGASLVLIPSATDLMGAALFRFLQEQGVTIVHFPAAAWHQSLDAYISQGGRFQGNLRLLLLGGERPDLQRLCQWGDALTRPLTFINAYGPTETTITATLYATPCHSHALAQLDSVPIGRPIPNVRVYVLDKHQQPVPVGVPGELYIGGAGVGRGYLNRPDLTLASFLPDPFSSTPGARMYRTGDLVRWLPDGNLEFLGRVDDQVKIRGFRVELGEIETTLKAHPQVADAVVLARKTPSGHNRLVAYVVARGDELSAAQLAEHLRQSLPEYMVPSAFIFLPALPLLPNGKVNRRALPEPEFTRPELSADYVAPATPAEEALAAIWAELLGLEQVGVHDNFFELGGDSMLSIQVIARAQQAGLHLQPRQIFQHPTIAELAAVALPTTPIHAEQGLVTGRAPLTPIQHWFFELDLPNPHHWNQSILLEVAAPLAAEPLRQALAALLAHHDALRLRFRQGEDGWQQEMGGMDDDIPLQMVDLADAPDEALSDLIQQTAAQAQASLHLENGPLLRVVYFDLGPTRPHRLLLVLHHLVVDGVSWRILTEDLQNAYAQAAGGETIVLPPKTTSYLYWAQRLQEYAGSDDVAEQLDFWLQAARAKFTPLPLDFNRGENTEASAQALSLELTPEETEILLQEMPVVYGSDVNQALLAALAQTLGKWAKSSSLLIEQEGHGRVDLFDDVNISRTVGWFTTIYPLHLTLPQSAGSSSAPRRVGLGLGRSLAQARETASPASNDPVVVLKAVHEQVQALPQQGIGYGLLRYLHPDPAVRAQLANLPQAQVSFNYLGQFDAGGQQKGGLRVAAEPRGPERDPRGRRQHIFELSASITAGVLRLNWRYSRNLHRAETVQGLADDFLQNLRKLIQRCRQDAARGKVAVDVSQAELSDDDLDALLDELDI